MNTKEIPVEASRYAELDQEARAIYRALYVHPERTYAVVLDSSAKSGPIAIPLDVYMPYLKRRLSIITAQLTEMALKMPDPEEPLIAPNP
jgi:hypothetical protein